MLLSNTILERCGLTYELASLEVVFSRMEKGNTLPFYVVEVPPGQLCKMKEYAPQGGGTTLELFST